MNISAISNNTQSFKRILVSTNGMGPIAKGLADTLERQIDYADSIHELDAQGVDVLIFADSKSPSDRAKIAFITPDNKLYKDDKKDHLKTYKNYNFTYQECEYDTNDDKVLEFAQKILDGEVKTTKRQTKTITEILKEFPSRAKSIFNF